MSVAASVRQRLLNRARTRGEEFEQLLVRFALERLLYRLHRSEHVEQFVLKGAQWHAFLSRHGLQAPALLEVVDALTRHCMPLLQAAQETPACNR